jgi:ornithine cyclodeaminase/alanine dehydrogenase-like protein (mu-crystallin family)
MLPRVNQPLYGKFTKEDYEAMLKELHREYLNGFATMASRLRYNPPKQTQVMTTVGMEPVKQCSVMQAQLPLSGWFGSKTIYFDYSQEGPTNRSSVTSLFKPDGSLAAVYESSYLTLIRTALMVILTTEQAGLKLNESTVVGLIGAGKVNFGVLYLLNHMRGVKHFFIHTRSECERFREKTKSLGIELHDDPGYPPKHLLRRCDFVASATTSHKPALNLEAVREQRLLIALDTGYLFGPSIREELFHFTDHPEQLTNHRELEFPYDLHWREPYCLTGFSEGFLPAIVSLYGVALADIVVAKGAYEREQSTG